MKQTGKGIARLLELTLMFSALLGLAGCAGTEITTEELWQQAMIDAVFSEDNEVMELVTLTSEDPRVIWDEAGERVLLLTWHSAEDRYEPGQAMDGSGEIWATSAGEMIDWYEANGQDVKNWTLRFAQLLGIPGDTDYGQFTAFWAHPKDVIRPAYETDVASQVKNDYGLVSQGAYKEWFDANILWSYFESEYPWTRLGYTYDWSGETSEYGLTEFLLFDGETSQVEFTLPTLEFVNWLEDQTAD